WVVGTRNHAKATVPKSVIVGAIDAAIAIERRMVKHVEELRPKLIVESFRNWAILVKCEVQVCRARSPHTVPACIAKCSTGRSCETRACEPVAQIVWTAVRIAPRNKLGVLIKIVTNLSRIIARDNVVGVTGRMRQEPGDFPASKGL